ncbi:MAG: hypothetical protein HC838_10960 [Spirulinaceae cyanobacterium RM2_2_10]|nr:hypothetical protein [Spirulinaceae cyanobacterium RM2_2_10]
MASSPNPIFIPTATGGFVDTDNNGSVTPGDTGLLQGALTGVGFDSNGFPIPFSQVGTVLQYNVGNFTSALSLPGTRVTATGIPQLFIPGAGLSVMGAGITASDGEMELGALAANIDDGLIALPSNTRFLSGSSPSTAVVSLFDIGRKIEFEFKGDDVDASDVNNDLDGSDGDLRFIGNTNEFEIETVGGGSLKFEVEGNIATLDFAVNNGVTVGNTTESGTFNPADPLDYEIEGQARGFLSLFRGNGIGFAGSNFSGGKPVEYEFSQDNGFRSEGKLRGNVNFLLATGQQNFDFDADFLNFSAPDLSSNTLFVQTRNITTVDIDIENINIDGFSFAFKDGKFDFDDIDFDIDTDSDDSEVAVFRRLFLLFLNDVDFSAFLNTFQGSIFALADDSDFADAKFSFYARPIFFGYTRPGGPSRVRIVRFGGDNFLIASRPGGRRAIAGLKMRGPNSRLFPGLVGLYDLSDEEVEEINDDLAFDDDLEDDDIEVDGDDDDE